MTQEYGAPVTEKLRTPIEVRAAIQTKNLTVHLAYYRRPRPTQHLQVPPLALGLFVGAVLVGLVWIYPLLTVPLVLLSVSLMLIAIRCN